MTQGLLIDTCALIWLGEAGEDHLGPAEDALDTARDAGQPICLSPMSAWEIGMLASKGRLRMAASPRSWLDRIMSAAGMTWASISPDVLIASSFLPDAPNADPADRIIIATAREHSLRIVTRDRIILDYARKGHVMALEC